MSFLNFGKSNIWLLFFFMHTKYIINFCIFQEAKDGELDIYNIENY